MGLAAFGGLRLCGLAAIVRFLFRDESARVLPEAGQTNYRYSDPQLDKSKPAQSLASKSEAGRKPLRKRV
ncbi:hypothetical protein [Chromobacterium sp. LK11]|uniref:hypothetical protein n=1 Tax=Chromobacterium sp. LK11 TaxID=1628212 RepID=UPI0018CE2413|nr:hypothetical protein [Chromobacterium sp. LK11]